VKALIGALRGEQTGASAFCVIPETNQTTVGALAELMRSFQKTRADLGVPDLSDPLTKKLYSTFLSYLPAEEFCYPLTASRDARGSFTEFLKTTDRGQISVSITRPGVIRGNHWHHTKAEKFLVVSGRGMIRLRRIHSDTVIEYAVSGDQPTVVDIPVGYTHALINIGEIELITVIWASEPFDPQKPDTYAQEV
jgi:UDP-2-acetamido-2,6-beta-L-arabino-hexul-4-ose reductase